MTAAADPTPTPHRTPPDIDPRYTAHRDADAPTTTHAAPAPASGPVMRARRTVSLWVASVVALVAFLVGLGVSMLVGPLGGPPDGGPGGTPPGASTSQGPTGTTGA